MTTPETWPEGARPPISRFKDQIGLLHHGSIWGPPLDPARWWSIPGAWADEYSSLLPFICGRIAQAQLGGLVITGQNGNQCPAHELNYLAMEYFGWHPERTYEQFQQDRLWMLRYVSGLFRQGKIMVEIICTQQLALDCVL